MVAIARNHNLKDMHTAMVAHNARLGGLGPPAQLAWEDCQIKLPMKGRLLYDDLTDLFVAASVSTRTPIIMTTLNLLHLRSAFFDMLKDNNLGMAHVNAYHIVECEMWTHRLCARLAAYKRGGVRAKSNTYRPEEFYPEKHEWMN
jgi:hypothetical protein